jgi:hypothetical protein
MVQRQGAVGPASTAARGIDICRRLYVTAAERVRGRRVFIRVTYTTLTVAVGWARLDASAQPPVGAQVMIIGPIRS